MILLAAHEFLLRHIPPQPAAARPAARLACIAFSLPFAKAKGPCSLKRLSGCFGIMPRKFMLAYLVSFVFMVGAFAQTPVDENAMFADTQTVVDNARAKPAASIVKKNSFDISGELSSIDQLYLGQEKNSYQNIALGSFLVDGRYNTNYKFFANVETRHIWENNESKLYLPECFIDTPIANKVYLRWGRQVLQWGRCYLWNPTDLINVDKKTFIQRIGSRDGVYGVKLHVPVGTTFNFYGFLDTGGQDFDADKQGGALKFEYLLGGTEMAFSFWDKDKNLPVYGYDFSSRAFNVDLTGEISASKGFTRDILRQEGDLLSMDKHRDEWITRASFDLGKNFHFNNQANKINVTAEGFYNGAGYAKNVFKDQTIYLYKEPLTLNGAAIAAGDKKSFFFGHDLYEANYYGKYYAALFTTVNDFFTSDYTFSANWIENLCDKSGILSLGIKYQNLKDWYVDLTAYTFLGKKNCEYTFLNQAVSFQLTLGWKF